MEIDKLLSNKNNLPNGKRKALNYIAFIKFLAMIKIIKWHIYKWDNKPIDYGARMCEILFISSGFLVGYNHYEKNMPCDYETSFKYTYKHLRTFYPLEFLNTLYGYFFRPGKQYNLTEYEILISNFLMIKSWSRYSRFASCFNGISWFLSALLFCYFLVPLLLRGIKNIKTSIILFFLFTLIRISSEELIYKGALNMFDAHFHRGPIIRLLEFYMGMLLTPTFFFFKYSIERYRNKLWFKSLFTFIQISSPIFIYFIMLYYNNILYRCYFVVIFCAYIFIISYDYGFLSTLFAKQFCVKIMSCQMEMYLIQNTINNIIYKINKLLGYEIEIDREVKFLIKLLIIFLVAYLYKALLKEKLAHFLDIILITLKKIIFNYSN